MRNSSDRLPDFIDPIRLAEQQRELRGQIPLSRMHRLASSLAVAEGLVDVDLRFGIDELGVRFMSGRIHAELALICQRCMEAMRVPVEAEVSLGLTRSDNEAERLPENYEPLLVGAEPMPLSAIVEDELMLALPIVSMHAPEQCPASTLTRRERAADDIRAEGGEPAAGPDADRAADQASPFAVLRALKDKET